MRELSGKRPKADPGPGTEPGRRSADLRRTYPGVDVGAMEAIHDRLLKKRSEGRDRTDLMELTEIMSLSDRIYVIFEGHPGNSGGTAWTTSTWAF